MSDPGSETDEKLTAAALDDRSGLDERRRLPIRRATTDVSGPPLRHFRVIRPVQRSARLHQRPEGTTAPLPDENRDGAAAEALFEPIDAVLEVRVRTPEVVRLVAVLDSPLEDVIVEQLRRVIVEVRSRNGGENPWTVSCSSSSNSSIPPAYSPSIRIVSKRRRSSIACSLSKNENGYTAPSTRSMTRS